LFIISHFLFRLLISPHIVFGSNPTILFLSRNFSRYIDTNTVRRNDVRKENREELWEENL